MAEMTVAQRDRFLAIPRMATLAYVGKAGAPIAVPVWFEWDGSMLRINTSVTSPKLKYLRQDPRLVLVAGNNVDEAEAWVAFHGRVTINEDGAAELGERLMQRYWPMTGDPDMDTRRRGYIEAFRSQEGKMACYVLEMIPDRIKAHWEFDDPEQN